LETNSGKQSGRELKYFDEKKLKEKISRKKLKNQLLHRKPRTIQIKMFSKTFNQK